MYSHPHAQYTRQVHAYERTVRRKVPQWVKALDRRDAQRLLKVCSELKWRLNPRLLLEAEQYGGPYSLWAQRDLPIDGAVKLRRPPLPKSFPSGTTFYDVDGIPVVIPPGKYYCPTAYDTAPPRPFGLQTLVSEGVLLSEGDFRKKFSVG